MVEVMSFLDTLAKLAMVFMSTGAMLQSLKNGRSLQTLKVEVNGKVSELLETHKLLAEARAKVAMLEGLMLSKSPPAAPPGSAT